MNLRSKLAAGSLILGASAQSFATVLPTDFATDMGLVEADITTVGGALIALAVVAVGIKWVKATFFG